MVNPMRFIQREITRISIHTNTETTERWTSIPIAMHPPLLISVLTTISTRAMSYNNHREREREGEREREKPCIECIAGGQREDTHFKYCDC